jgi:hypothetical protein
VDVQQPDGEQRDRELVAGSRPPSFIEAVGDWYSLLKMEV